MAKPRALDPKLRGELRQFRMAGNTVKACAAYFGISEATCYRELADMRKRIGPERVRGRESYARWKLTARSS
jgi:hypothetical protein